MTFKYRGLRHKGYILTRTRYMCVLFFCRPCSCKACNQSIVAIVVRNVLNWLQI